MRATNLQNNFVSKLDLLNTCFNDLFSLSKVKKIQAKIWQFVTKGAVKKRRKRQKKRFHITTSKTTCCYCQQIW